MNDLDIDENVTATLTPNLGNSKEGERVESVPRQVMSAKDDFQSDEEQGTAAFATPYHHEREFLSPGEISVRSRSPTETGSFHTAESLDSDRDTEMDEDEEREQIDTMALIAGSGREKKPLPPSTRSPVSRQLPPQPQLYDLPAGYEDQPKLATREESIEPLQEKEPIPMDSRSYRTPYNSNQPPRADPVRRATPQETTPLLPPPAASAHARQQQQQQQSNERGCCTII